MDKHQKLSESRTFRAALFTPIAVGLCLLGITAYFNGDYSYCFSSECLNTFFTLYKYPLSVMGLGVPLSAIAAAIHRSEETSLQIRTSENQLAETLKQNKFNNYIKHKEEFVGLLEKIEAVCNCKFNDPLYLYKQIFPKNNYRRVNFNAHSNHDMYIHPNNFLKVLRSNQWELTIIIYDEATGDKQLAEAVFNIDQITTTLRLSRDPAKQYLSDSKKLIWPDEFSTTSFNHIKYITQNLISFSSFEEPDNEKRKNAMALVRRQGAGNTKFINCLAIDRFAIGVDDYL